MVNDNTIYTKFGTANLQKNGYYMISSRKEGHVNKLLHRVLFEDFYNIHLPPNIVIHHNDGDKTNNNIWNLIPMTLSEHTSFHLKDRVVSKETCKKLSNAKKGDKNPNYGKKPSEYQIKKLLEKIKGKPMSLQHRIKLSISRNTSGFFKVSVDSRKGDYYFKYHYTLNGKRTHILRTTLKELKNEVEKRGQEWIILDEKKARKTCDLKNEYELLEEVI